MCAECEKAKTLKYRGFTCLIQYTHDVRLFQALCTETQFGYQSGTVQELEQAFCDSIDSYLSFYKEIGIKI